jgi:fucose permease
VALGAFVLIGLIDGALGVAWPSMRGTFGSTGYLAASVGYGWLHSNVGTGGLLGAGSTLLVFGLSGVALAPAWGVVAIAAIVLGLGGGLVDTGMNAHAALAFDVGSINLLHACYGVGATLGPIVITLSLIASDAWRAGYSVLAGLQVLSAIAIWARIQRWVVAEPDVREDHPVGGRRLQLWSLLVLFFLYTGVEVATGQWAFTLLSEGRGMGTGAAGTWVAVYWAGLTVGRFGFGVVGERLSPSRILGSSMVVCLVGIAVVWADPAGWGALGLPIAGLGFAAVFPTLVSLTPARIGRLRSTRAMGFQLAAANLGAAGVPWILGLMAEARGLETLGAGLFVTAALLAIVHGLSDRDARRPSI